MPEEARILFAQACVFFHGAQRLDQLPEPQHPEIAFAGRSNVGKSSLINALTNQKALARASSQPGRTKQLNFFDLGGRLTLVDMPGLWLCPGSERGEGGLAGADVRLPARPASRCAVWFCCSTAALN